MYWQSNRGSAFSLVELSIVLVILGLLVGGVLSGQSLIRAAELRAVGNEYQRYVAASYMFRDRYFALPGDMVNATQFWGKDNASCPGNSGTIMTPGTCNGNGDNILTPAAAANSTGEIFQYWKQLALAGLIEGSYSGLAGPIDGSFVGLDGVPGTNLPSSKSGGGTAWGVIYLAGTPYGGDTITPAYNYGNSFIYGKENTSSSYLISGAVLKTEDAWNIDTKVDDGLPLGGKFIATYWGVCTTGTTSSDKNARYRLDATGLQCGFRVADVGT